MRNGEKEGKGVKDRKEIEEFLLGDLNSPKRPMARQEDDDWNQRRSASKK